VTVLVPVQPNTVSRQQRLSPTSPLTRSTQVRPRRARKSRPLFAAVLPGGSSTALSCRTRITGTVQKASAAGWMKRNGRIVFAFSSVRMPDGTTREIHATVGGIQAERSEGLDVGKEGEIKATTSTFARLLAPVSLIGPSRAVADTICRKTAWSRAGEGRKGFGLLGAGAAQASAGTAIGSDILAPQRDFAMHSSPKVQTSNFPVNTPIFLRLDSNDPSVALVTR